MTIEDPIEFLHEHRGCIVNQREVGADTHGFRAALRQVLRQDPDVILVGELRDLETISVALTAAETGHLVLATLHTQSAQDTISPRRRRLPLRAAAAGAHPAGRHPQRGGLPDPGAHRRRAQPRGRGRGDGVHHRHPGDDPRRQAAADPRRDAGGRPRRHADPRQPPRRAGQAGPDHPRGRARALRARPGAGRVARLRRAAWRPGRRAGRGPRRARGQPQPLAGPVPRQQHPTGGAHV